jgi:hypothetical protein
VAIWGTAAFLWLLPLVAMRFTDEVAWDLADFAVFGAMLVVACGAYEVVASATSNGAYRAAVGIIGDEGNPANWMYGGILAVGIIGAIMTRFQPRGMARALVATAHGQALVALLALIAGSGDTLTLLILTGFFVTLWLTSAWLFRKKAPLARPARGHSR